MELTRAEQEILSTFDKTADVRFAHLESGDRDIATRGLIEKGVLARLADGEYWLTELGVQFLTTG